MGKMKLAININKYGSPGNQATRPQQAHVMLKRRDHGMEGWKKKKAVRMGVEALFMHVSPRSMSRALLSEHLLSSASPSFLTVSSLFPLFQLRSRW